MQERVKTFVALHGLRCGEQVRYMDLVSEVGELGKELVKGSHYGTQTYKQTEATRMEVGDCLFALLALCDELGVDAEDALQNALDKYEARYKVKGRVDSGK